jgi:hypothetical protein
MWDFDEEDSIKVYVHTPPSTTGGSPGVGEVGTRRRVLGAVTAKVTICRGRCWRRVKITSDSRFLALMGDSMVNGPAVRKHVARVIVVIGAAMICTAAAVLTPAWAQTPLAAFCADNAAELQRTNHEVGLDPAKWASDPKNLARLGFNGPGDIDTLYHKVIDQGAPAITSHWSNMNGDIEWRCQGQ